jgi:hypothetical protein
MRGQHTLDRQPGTLPEITTDSHGITFVMTRLGSRRGEQLIIRCDTNGEIWMSIRPERTA